MVVLPEEIESGALLKERGAKGFHTLEGGVGKVSPYREEGVLMQQISDPPFSQMKNGGSKYFGWKH